MHSQEVVFFIGQMIFNISLLPSIFSNDKPALATSLITAVVIFVYVYTYTTLSLWVTAVSVFTTGALWAVLAYQKYKIDKRRKK